MDLGLKYLNHLLYPKLKITDKNNEHVTKYIWDNKKEFKIQNIEETKNIRYPALRLILIKIKI